MSTSQRHIVEPPETRMVLENVAWDTYIALTDQRRGSIPRMTYDNGMLEMMSPKREHENIGRLIGRMIETYSELQIRRSYLVLSGCLSSNRRTSS